MGRYKVKLHKWVDGKLHHIIHELKTLEDAQLFAKQADCDVAKITTANDTVIGEVINSQNAPQPSYA
jgi:hypothetical protein